MAANVVQEVQAHHFSDKDRLFLDANVWLLLYGPVASYRQKEAAAYSRALRDALMVGSAVHVDVLVMSEFVNRYARMEQRRSSRFQRADFKAYRSDPEFVPVARAICKEARRIAGHVKCCASSFADSDVQATLAAFESGQSDFNDLVIAQTCAQNGLVLITDDADFAGAGIQILTANLRLLNA